MTCVHVEAARNIRNVMEHSKPTSVQNLLLVRKDDQILLAMKKRGFGAGWWNGYGGKVMAGETVEEALVREVKEESGMVLKSCRKVGFVRFENVDKFVEVHIFEAKEIEGEPVETEEMSPKWFPVTNLPYDKMWKSDFPWYQLYFAGKLFKGEVVFDEKHTVLSSNIYEVASLD